MSVVKVAIVRGKYLNNFEMQNYFPLRNKFQLTAFASLFPIHKEVGFPVRKLASPLDLAEFPYKLPFLNRLMIDAMYLFDLEEKLKGFDLVCVRETYFHFTQQALNAKQKGWVKKILVTCSETIPFNHEGIWGRKSFKKRVIAEADHFHCLTEKAKECLVKEGVGPQKITVIGYGVDLNRFKFETRFMKKVRENRRLLFVGRLEEQKGVVELIKTYQSLKQNFPNLKLTVVGKGPLKPMLEKIGIKILSLPYSQMPRIYQEADIFVLPSKATKYWEEYYGMALLEAMASGLPVITTDCGVIPEVVGKAAFIVKQGKIKDLENGIRKFIKNKKLRVKYSQLSKKHARKHFNCQKQAGKIADLWLKILRE